MPEELPFGVNSPRILVIDDDEAMLQSLARVLRSEGFGEVLLCGDPRQAVTLLETHDIGVVLLDLVMPHLSGEKLLDAMVAGWPGIAVLVLTATNEVDTAVRCVKAGAFDFLVKPVDFPRLLTAVTQAQRHHQLTLENRRLQHLIREPQLRHPQCFAPIMTRAPVLQAMFRHIEAIAPSREPVLIFGETGVGKELVAQALHRASGRPGDLLAINVAGIDDSSFADTLFGHVKGAFTGADRDREGMIERAGEGTLFLDEIGDLGMDLQTKLLRLLQEGEFFALGSDRSHRSRCRILAATNRDLGVRLREGRFRADLYYRLNGHLITVPPLRDRTEDIPLLVECFLHEAAESLGKPVPTVPKELAVHLSAYRFPGNVRELRAMVVDAVARHEKGVLSLVSFHEHMDKTAPHVSTAKSAVNSTGSILSFPDDLPTLEEMTNSLIAEALRRTDGNQGAAARMLDISRRTISRHINDGGSPSGV
jgi:two-component system nitrogen regulation response regulator GlnG